jgi:hypothetical protein
VIAANNSGVWNKRGDMVEFSVDPAYYQTNWFRALCMAVFFALLSGLYHLRVLQLQREFNAALDARVGERTRIARELHDTLLQSFHAVLLRLQTVSGLLPDGEPKQKLDSTIEQAAEAITEGRDAVEGLRGSTVQTNALALALRTLKEDLVAASSDQPPEFRVTVEGEPRDLHPIIRDDIYRLAAEALRNTFHHAQAKKSKLKSIMTRSGSDCSFETTAGAWTSQCSRTVAAKVTTAFLGCSSAPRSLAASWKSGASSTPAQSWSLPSLPSVHTRNRGAVHG